MHCAYLSALWAPAPRTTVDEPPPPEPLPLDELKLGPPLLLGDDGRCEFAGDLRCAIDGLLEPHAASTSASETGAASFLAPEKVGMRQ
jgi:hypothetical protein